MLFGIWQWLLVGGVVAYFISRSNRAHQSLSPALALRKFEVNQNPVDGVYVEIIGRASGVIGWFLTAVGLSDETRFSFRTDEVTYADNSLAGTRVILVPLSKVASTHGGYIRSLWLFVVGALIMAAGLIKLLGTIGDNGDDATAGVALFFLAIFVGGAFLLAFHVSRRLFLSVETYGGNQFGLTFKRSFIENVELDFDLVDKAIKLMNRVLVDLAGQSSQPDQPGAPAIKATPADGVKLAAKSATAQTPKPPVRPVCPSCSEPVAADASFCGNCGARLSS